MTDAVPFRYIWQERGKSVARIMINWVLQQWRDEVTGLALDLGSGYSPSYWRLTGWKVNPKIWLVSVDCDLAVRPSVVADLSLPLPFKDGIADSVIVGGVLMLLPDPLAALNEARRLLKPGGVFTLYTALIFNYNPAPHDYWRFTEDALRFLLERAGFVNVTVVPVGGRWTAAAYLLSPFLRPRQLVPPFSYWLCLKLDAWTEKSLRLPKCPIGHIVKARASA